ncbi:MAG: hypothetical protein LBS19_15840 [Clostridiales bacterium]|nr:hypothetical protein [Clostridiales bacterium]
MVYTTRQQPGTVVANTSQTVSAACPAGYAAAGGGARIIDSTTGQPISGAVISESRPVTSTTQPSNGQQASGWQSTIWFAQNATNVIVDAYAICTPIA